MSVYQVEGSFVLLIDADDYDAAFEAAFDGVEIRDQPRYLSEPVMMIDMVSHLRDL